MKISPMMQQYFAIKDNYKDCILFYRVGDFYEMFYDDAKLASKELDLTLTGKSCGQEERAPMCGVPYHAAEIYIHRLVEKGYKVAICEQTEDPSLAKGLVSRDVVRIITPGTLTSQNMLEENENNYLASFYMSKTGVSMSYCDISTGELAVTESEGSSSSDEMIDELCRIGAKEILINDEADEAYGKQYFNDITGAYISVAGREYWQEKAARDIITGQLGSAELASSGIASKPLCLSSLCALLSYLLETQRQSLKQINKCRYFELKGKMALDKVTLRNLEITETLYEKNIKGSLLSILDKTKTAMGGRLIKKWLREPLSDVNAINMRLDAVEALCYDPLLLNNISEDLKQVYDFERLSARVASGNANGRDLIALKNSAAVMPEVKDSLSDSGSSLLRDLSEQIADLSEICQLITESISEEAPFTVREGGIIKEGWSSELDSLKASIKDAKDWIAGLETRERERTGIKTLRVGYNKVFGYYIDVTRANADLVPEDYIRKQTLVNNERYITPELKDMENLVLNAETKINKAEYDLFTSVRERIEKRINDIQKTSEAIAAIDVISSFADVSTKYGYTKPDVDDSFELLIEKGRHPVIERMDRDVLFVSNDTYINNKDSSMIIITGPNMSGKSTYMRQTALIVLMAQAGCFVPCERAHIGAVDRIFTRIGASDNLSQGQSTFYVEMSELAYILNYATEKSLIILDEIGRGTSTYDGLSIAWATVEYLCNPGKRIRTLFATHYHELTALEASIKGVKNLNVDVSEANGDIIFLHRIIEGAASRSYGIHVAKIAGAPKELLENAESKLYSLENASTGIEDDRYGQIAENADFDNGDQLSLFIPGKGDEIVNKLKDLDLMEITPSGAIGILEELKKLI